MKHTFDALRMVIISVESLIIISIFLLNYYYPKIFLVLGESIKNENDIKKWLPAIPIALCGCCCITLLWKLIAPLNNSNKELYDWPDFWRLKMRVYYSVILSVLSAGIACSLWILSKQLQSAQIGVLFAISLGISITNTACMLFASVALRVIMEKEEKATP